VTIKGCIGEGPGRDENSVTGAFSFRFQAETIRGQMVYWNPPPDIAEVFGEKPTEFLSDLLHDDPREVWPLGRNTRCGRARAAYCHGELVQIAQRKPHARYDERHEAIRRTTEHPEGESWQVKIAIWRRIEKMGSQSKGCGEAAQTGEWQCGLGRFYFILGNSQLGRHLPLHTGSKTSVPICRTPWLNSTVGMGAIEVGQSHPEVRRSFDGIPGSSESGTFRVPILSLEIGGRR